MNSTAGQRIDRLLSKVEWRWSLSNLVIGAYLLASTALPAWAVSAMTMFQQYAPLSWVLAGFAGLVAAVVIFAVFSVAYRAWVKGRYNSRLYERSGFVDPMAKTFENRRIFLSEFTLPSDPYIEGKTFINCELIGPAVLYFRNNNQVFEHGLPHCDALLLREQRKIYNAITIDNCTFRKCSFKRITVVVSETEYHTARNNQWLNWFDMPVDEPQLPGMTDLNQDGVTAPPMLEGIATEKQR